MKIQLFFQFLFTTTIIVWMYAYSNFHIKREPTAPNSSLRNPFGIYEPFAFESLTYNKNFIKSSSKTVKNVSDTLSTNPQMLDHGPEQCIKSARRTQPRNGPFCEKPFEKRRFWTDKTEDWTHLRCISRGDEGSFRAWTWRRTRPSSITHFLSGEAFLKHHYGCVFF